MDWPSSLPPAWILVQPSAPTDQGVESERGLTEKLGLMAICLVYEKWSEQGVQERSRSIKGKSLTWKPKGWGENDPLDTLSNFPP